MIVFRFYPRGILVWISWVWVRYWIFSLFFVTLFWFFFRILFSFFFQITFLFLYWSQFSGDLAFLGLWLRLLPGDGLLSLGFACLGEFVQQDVQTIFLSIKIRLRWFFFRCWIFAFYFFSMLSRHFQNRIVFIKVARDLRRSKLRFDIYFWVLTRIFFPGLFTNLTYKSISTASATVSLFLDYKASALLVMNTHTTLLAFLILYNILYLLLGIFNTLA